MMLELFAPQGHRLFFGVGTGRCGTMFLSNVLSAHKDVLCLHEGMQRHRTEKGEALLDFLTLQNYMAYAKPTEADGLFHKARSGMPMLRKRQRKKWLGDIAYNYAPFVGSIHRAFPGAHIIYIYRNGVDFVRSVVTDTSPDPCPVGWQESRSVTREERYIALGRLRPTPTNPLVTKWQTMDLIGKNAWLWAETNRLIIDGLKDIPESLVLRVKFEDFFADVEAGYARISQFLGIKGGTPAAAQTLLHTPINTRDHKILPTWDAWDDNMRASFLEHAGEMMQVLGYHLPTKLQVA